MKILITGATGLLGNNAVRLALEQGHEVYTLARSSSDHPALSGLAIRHIQSDLNAPDLGTKLDQVAPDAIIHSAALIHIGWKNLEASLLVNERGTQNLCDWVGQRKVRGVYVSTVNVLPIGSETKAVCEADQGDGQLPTTYVLSKRAAQKVIDRAIDAGQDWVSVFPGFMLGPNDWQLSSGQMIQPLQRFQPWAPAGGCSVCDPRDVSGAMLRLACQSNKERRYILAGQNMTYLDLWTRIARQLGSRPPLVAMRKPARAIGILLANAWNSVRPKEHSFNSAAIQMGQQFHYYDSRLAKEHLEYSPRSADESIRDAIDWMRNHGFLQKR